VDFLNGGNPTLKATTARVYTLGADLKFGSQNAGQAGMTYFRISQTDKVVNPFADAVDVLLDRARWGSLVTLNTTVAQVEAALALSTENVLPVPFNPADVKAIADFRLINAGEVLVDGIDFNAHYRFDTGLGLITPSAQLTYYAHNLQQLTSLSPSIENAGQLYSPARLRAQASLAWARGPWSAISTLNYTGGLEDTLDVGCLPPLPSCRVVSWTTVDLSVRYALGQTSPRSLLSGTSINLSAINLLGRDPPRVNDSATIRYGFDPTNATGLGRFVSLDLRKRW
ncbi:MAG: TonB-dependent receptor domain-containing protein, partial [Candidatus Dormibacteraceae bacterium]